LGIAEEALTLPDNDATESLRANLTRAYLDLGHRSEAEPHARVLTTSQDPTIRTLAWCYLVQISNQASKDTSVELEEAIAAAEHTEHPVALARVVISVHEYGTAEQWQRLEPLRRRFSPDNLNYELKARYEAVLAAHIAQGL
jgi:hypothetical protein